MPKHKHLFEVECGNIFTRNHVKCVGDLLEDDGQKLFSIIVFSNLQVV